MTSVDLSREPLMTLNKDGISDEFLKLLWLKDEMNFSPSINIPDTIVYKYGQPTAWYFTAKNGHIKKKNKHNLVSSKIEEAFNQNLLGYDVVAYFISMVSDHALEKQQSQENNQGSSVIEYFDRESLSRFLYNHSKEVNGILQLFIDPKTTHNEVIRAIWSPKLCLLERAENIHHLHDKRYGLYEKCVIYEGPNYYYTTSPLRGPVLAGQIQKLCETAVAHVSEVTYGQKQVFRIVLTLKLDSREKLWLLYSTSIRCFDMMEFKPLGTDLQDSGSMRSLVNIDSVISLSEKVTLNPFKTYQKIVPKLRKACVSCTTETTEDLRHPVTYKSVIKHYEHVLLLLQNARSKHTKEGAIEWPPNLEIIEAAGGVGFCGLLNEIKAAADGGGGEGGGRRKGEHMKYKYLKDLQIPPVIGSLHPKLTTETYLRCKNDPLFYNKSVQVCESCYLVYAEFTSLLLDLGEDISKLVSSSGNANSLLLQTRSLTTADRPSSSDWRAISTANNSTDLFRNSQSAPSLHHYEAKMRSIGLRSDDDRPAPHFPEAVRSRHDTTASSIAEGEESLFESTARSPFRGGLLEESQSLANNNPSVMSSSFAYDAKEVQSLIVDRERRFFKEISLNPQLKDSHPLQHLISTQQKLKLIDEQSGVLMSNKDKGGSNLGTFGAKYGAQVNRHHKPFGPYQSEIPYTLNGEIILPSELKARKFQTEKLKKLQKQRALASFLSGGGGNEPEASSAKNPLSKLEAPQKVGPPAAAAPKNTSIDSNIKNSKKYREFLEESLKRIEFEANPNMQSISNQPSFDS